jgi:hypothetical protein
VVNSPQGRWLAQVICGFFAYHAVPINFSALSAFRHHIRRLWLRTLRRRSQKDRFSWERMTRLADDFLPQPKTVIGGQALALPSPPKVGAACLNRPLQICAGAVRNDRPYRDQGPTPKQLSQQLKVLQTRSGCGHNAKY